LLIANVLNIGRHEGQQLAKRSFAAKVGYDNNGVKAIYRDLGEPAASLPSGYPLQPRISLRENAARPLLSLSRAPLRAAPVAFSLHLAPKQKK
jgi:hypothetical protein